MSAVQYQEKPAEDAGSVEKGSVREFVAPAGDDRYDFNAADLDRVQRKLKQRHVQMIAIAGTIGTGLFLGSGKALAGAGPLGALIAYALIGSVAYSSLCSIGEMTFLAPISGTFPHFAARWADPALGFAAGWNYLYSNAISIPAEISAAQILITFWDDKHGAGYLVVLSVLVILINVFGVRWFGEAEFGFAIIKLMLITGLIIGGLAIDLGGGPDHKRIGFKYWKDPGPFAPAGLVSNINTDRFLGILSVLIQAAFSFQGMELVAIAASETQNPRQNISKAVRRVFYRILIFYMLGVLVTGMLVPYNDENLLKSAVTAAESPYVIAMRTAGVKVLPGLINACVLTSAFSAGNSYLFCSSRILYGLALRGQAPKILAHCTKKGLPIYAVLACSLFVWLSFMSLSSGANKAFVWLSNLSAIAGFITWFTINLTYTFFYRGLKEQGIDRTKFIYYSNLQPYLAYWGVFWTVLLVFISGFSVFFDFNVSDFFAFYVNIPLFIGLYAFWKFFKKTKIWKPAEMDFVTGIPTIEETEHEIPPPTTFLGRIAEKVF